jgi:hypothetical protein
LPTAAFTAIVVDAGICEGAGEANRIDRAVDGTMLIGVDFFVIFGKAVDADVAMTVTASPDDGANGGAT